MGYRLTRTQPVLSTISIFTSGFSGLPPIEDGRISLAFRVFWMTVGKTGEIHLFGGEQPSPLAKGADQDPASPHLALAMADILEAKAELDRRGMPYWSLTRVAGPQALQLFVRDPYGNMIELHQVDHCRCRAVNRRSR